MYEQKKNTVSSRHKWNSSNCILEITFLWSIYFSFCQAMSIFAFFCIQPGRWYHLVDILCEIFLLVFSICIRSTFWTMFFVFNDTTDERKSSARFIHQRYFLLWFFFSLLCSFYWNSNFPLWIWFFSLRVQFSPNKEGKIFGKWKCENDPVHTSEKKHTTIHWIEHKNNFSTNFFRIFLLFSRFISRP